MADLETPTLSEDKDRRKAGDRERAQVEPIPKRLDFFKWIENQFYEETDEAAAPPAPAEADPSRRRFPEKIDACPASGPKYQRLHKPVYSYPFPSGSVKPSKPRLVQISNEILFRCQRDCDIQRKRTVYSVNVWHFSLDSEPYESWLLEMHPGQTHALAGSPRPESDEDEDGQEGVAKKHSLQILGHHEQMFRLYGGGFEGLLDRLDRDKERDAAEIQRLRQENRELREQLERALSLEAERTERREMARFKVKTLDRAAEIGFGLAPSLLGRFLGQSVAGGESAESMTLKPFFKSKEEGGILTAEQADAIFGCYDKEKNDSTGKPLCLKSGVLSFDQAKLLFDVSQCRIPPDALDQLLPDGPHAFGPDQFMRLQTQCGLETQHLAPLFAIFEPRMKRWSDRRGGGGSNGSPNGSF